MIYPTPPYLATMAYLYGNVTESEYAEMLREYAEEEEG